MTSSEDPFMTPEDVSPESRAPREFEAQWRGQCSDCGDDIEPGDMIRADGYGEWECADHAG